MGSEVHQLTVAGADYTRCQVKTFVIGVVLAIPLAAQLTPNPKFRETAVVGAFRELNPEVVGFTTIYRAKVSDDEDVAVIRGGDLLGIFVLSRSAPDVAYTITIDVDAGSGRVEALLAGADGVVIRRTGDYGFESPRLRYFFNARTKAYYGRREFAPGHTVIDGGRLVVSDPDPAAYRPDGCGSGVGFGPGGAYSVAAGAPKMYGEPGCVVRRGDKMFVVAKGALEDYAAARPKRVELNGMPDVAGLNETIGPWQVVDGRLWFGLTFYDGEGLTGVGGFGWFDTAEEVFDVRRPAEMAAWSVSAILVEADAVWLGLKRRPEGMEYSGGLLRWDRATGKVRRWPEVPLVREFQRVGGRLLVAAQGGGAVVEGDRVEVYVTDVDRAGRMRLTRR